MCRKEYQTRELTAAMDHAIADQVLLGQLAVFDGGCTVGAASAVTGGPGPEESRSSLADRLANLVESDLLIVKPQPDGTARYHLPTSLEEPAQALLDADPAAGVVRRRHAGYFADLAERAGEELIGPERAAWLLRVEQEQGNLARAFTATMGAGDVAEAVRICTGLWPYWLDGRSLDQGRDWFGQLIAHSDTMRDTAVVRVSYAAARLAAAQNDHDSAVRLAEAGLRRAESIDDLDGASECHEVLRQLGAARQLSNMNHAGFGTTAG
jgi:hypothetical protein